jgi:formylmethanofuran dehydrogenase subunit C
MRRGLIAVGGDSGDFAGVSLIAGSVFLFGKTGLRIGAGMKRGTIALFGDRPQLLPTFRFDCVYRPVYLRLYLRQIQAWGFPLPDASLRGFYERYSGDLVSLGKGEILYWQSDRV